MKIRIMLSLLVVLLLVTGCGERPVQEPGVLVVIIDGLRPDKLESAYTPFLDELQKGGAFTDRARAVMPTITRSNFVTIATGVHTDRHGIVGGTFRDDQYTEHRTDRPTYTDAQEDLPVPTVFEILEDHGKKTAMFSMKGYELVGARGASFQWGGSGYFPDALWRYRYERSVDGSEDEAIRRKLQMNNVLIDSLSALLATAQVDFILLNLGATDYIGHVYGPESEAYIRGVETTDGHVSEIVGMLQRYYPTRDWYVIIGSDHGFSQTDSERVVLPVGNNPNRIPELAQRNIEHILYERGGRAAELYLRDSRRYRDAHNILRRLPWVARVYSNHEVPEKAGTLDDLRVAFPGRHGDFYIITNPAYALNFSNDGQHGSNDDVDVLIPLYIHAPGRVSAGSILEGATNLDIAPTVARLMNIDDERINTMEGRSLVE